MIGFDKLYDCKGMTYERQVNERIPKKYDCKLYTDEEIQDSSVPSDLVHDHSIPVVHLYLVRITRLCSISSW